MLTKIILLGLLVCVVNLLLQQYLKAFILPINIVFITVVVLMFLDSAAESMQKVTDLFTVTPTVSKALICIYKSAGICIVTKVAVDLCKESGNAVVSDMIDFAGRIIILSLSFPFIESIIKTASAFIK